MLWQPIGAYGLRYVTEKLHGASATLKEKLFWQQILAYFLREEPLSAFALSGLRFLDQISRWYPPGWLQKGRRMTFAAELIVLPGPNQSRALAYWSLHMATLAGRLHRCNQCHEPCLGRNRRATKCHQCHGSPRPPGRPRSLPRAIAPVFRQLQNRLYQWQHRGAVPRDTVRALLVAMRAEALTVATNQISPSQFARTWQRRLATPVIAMETLRHLT